MCAEFLLDFLCAFFFYIFSLWETKLRVGAILCRMVAMTLIMRFALLVRSWLIAAPSMLVSIGTCVRGACSCCPRLLVMLRCVASVGLMSVSSAFVVAFKAMSLSTFFRRMSSLVAMIR